MSGAIGPLPANKKILIIGGGSSGLTSIKACKEENFDVVCFEKTGFFGGLWRYRDEDIEGVPSVMKSTISNSSKEMSSFSDFPTPPEFPTYMPHSKVIKYLELYAERFNLSSCIIYHQEVKRIIPAEDYSSSGRWQVSVKDLTTKQTREEVFDGVMICVGHHVFPLMPSYPGLDLYKGEVLHSHSYKTFKGFEGKSVLIVGAGNSGTDIAVEVSRIAQKVYLSTRRGTWIFPRTLHKEVPLDAMLIRRCKGLLPASFNQWKIQKSLNSRLPHGKWGIKPNHKSMNQRPTINDDIHVKLLSGLVTFKRNIKAFTEYGVTFDGESEEIPVDVILLATGYEIKIPFVSEDLISVSNNNVSLYKNVYPPQLKHPTLAVIGLIQPYGPLFPVFEMQARWSAAVMTGRVKLPSSDEMLDDVKAVQKFRAKHFVQSPRHTVEVPWIEYMDDIARKIGVRPNLLSLFFHDQKLFWACYKGPCLPYQYRLNGLHSWMGAKEAIRTYKDRIYNHIQGKELEKRSVQ